MGHEQQETSHAEALGTGELIAGIVRDAKHLGDQYVALLRIELARWAAGLARLLAIALVGSGLWCAGVFFLGIALGVGVDGQPLATALTYGGFAFVTLIAGSVLLLRLRRGPSDQAGPDQPSRGRAQGLS